MGCDIYGWVEVKNHWTKKWFGLIKIQHILGSRAYDMFGSLFGIRNTAGFKPIAFNRGLPKDASDEVLEKFSINFDLYPSWLTWKEISNIDWEEEATEVRDYIDRYMQDENGEIIFIDLLDIYISKAEIEIFTSYDWELLNKGLWVQKDNMLYKREKKKRKEGWGVGWDTLFDLMKRLAEDYGDKNVRLVAWFDMP